jgi:WD40 domain-containing protein
MRERPIAEDGTVRLWDVQARRPLGRPLNSMRTRFDDLAFSPDGATLGSVAHDEPVRLCDVRTHRALGGPRSATRARLAFSPDRTLATVSGRTVRLWSPVNLRRAAPTPPYANDMASRASATTQSAIANWRPLTHGILVRRIPGRDRRMARP